MKKKTTTLPSAELMMKSCIILSLYKWVVAETRCKHFLSPAGWWHICLARGSRWLFRRAALDSCKRDTENLRRRWSLFFEGWCRRGWEAACLTLKSYFARAFTLHRVVVILCCWKGFILNLQVPYYAYFKILVCTPNSTAFQSYTSSAIRKKKTLRNA